MTTNHHLIDRDPREMLYATGAANTAKGASVGATVGGSIGSIIPVLGTAVGGAIGAAVGAVVGVLVNPTKKAIKNIRKDSDKLFLADRDDVDDMLAKAGYKRPDRGGRSDAPTFTQFKIKGDQVSGKSDDYKYAYERLQKFLIKMLNTYQPGLGDLYKPYNPVAMRSANNVAHQWMDYIEAFIQTYPAESTQAKLVVKAYKDQQVSELKAQGATAQEIEEITGEAQGMPKAATAGFSIVAVVIFILIVLGMTRKG